MRLEYRGEGRWTPLHGAFLENFVSTTGALTGPGLPMPVWQPLPFYDFTALVRLPDPVGGASEWYITQGANLFTLDKFGAAISALNETAHLRLTRDNVSAYFRFWCAFTTAPFGRYVVLDVPHPEMAEEAADETDTWLRGVVVEGHGPQGYLLSATVFHKGEVQRRNFRVSNSGAVMEVAGHALSLPERSAATIRRAS